MGKVNIDVFDRALQVAKKSTMTHKHGALIIKNGEIIAEGFNHTADFMSHSWSIHSEVAALLNLKKQHRHKKYLEDVVMLVVRVGGINNQECRMSAPCCRCREAIEKAGIKKIFYSSSSTVLK